MRAMQFAFHLHAIRHHWRGAAPGQEELRKAVRRIRTAGFDGIDVSDSWPFETLTPPAAAEVRATAEGHGLQIPVVSCMGKTLCHPALGEANLRAVAWQYDYSRPIAAANLNIVLARAAT